MNRILSKIIESRKGHYIHALEVSTIDEIREVIESIIHEFPEESEETVIDFFSTMSIYPYPADEDEENRQDPDIEQKIYDLDMEKLVKGVYFAVWYLPSGEY